MYINFAKLKNCPVRNISSIFLLILIFILVSCYNKKGNNSNGEVSAHDNHNIISHYKKKFSAAYHHYSLPKDSLKLKALDFLVNNLDDQYYTGGSFFENYKSIILRNGNLSTIQLKNISDSLINKGYEIKKVKDDNVITSEFLIANIDDAFEVWGLPWAKGMSFSDFCEYVLPYKSANEEPGYWRSDLREKYKWVIDSSKNTNNPIIPVNYINSDLSNWYKVSLTYSAAVDLDYKMATHIGTGTCDNACKMTMYPMKALGLPVALDFVTHWGNRSSNHIWNVLVSNDKKYVFDATEASIGSKKIQFVGVGRMSFKISKVFRNTYSIQKNSLGYLNNSYEDIPEEFRNNRMKDVTDEYVPTSNLLIKTGDIPHSRYAYLTVFNNEEWMPIDWGEFTDSNHVKFIKVGRDIAYLPATYTKNSIKPFSTPFILDKKGTVRALSPDTTQLINITVLKKYPEDDSNNIKPGNMYELFYWNEGWKTIGKQYAQSKSLLFKRVPSNALFWLRDLTEGKQERIFTYENGKQIWW